MKRFSTVLALCLALGNTSSIIASPLLIAAALAQIASPHLGKMITASTTSSSSNNASTNDLLKAQEIIKSYEAEHQKELTAMLERFTKAREAVFGIRYFDDAKTGTLKPWKDNVFRVRYFDEDESFFKFQISFALDQVNDEKFLTTLGLYYKPTEEAEPILLQRRRVELPRTTMPKPGDADYNNDQKYIDALKTDMQRYMDVSTTDIQILTNEDRDVIAHYRKQAHLIESTN